MYVVSCACTYVDVLEYSTYKTYICACVVCVMSFLVVGDTRKFLLIPILSSLGLGFGNIEYFINCTYADLLN